MVLVLCLRFNRRWSSRAALGWTVPLAVAGALFPLSWDQGLMNCGVYYYAPRYGDVAGLKRVAQAKDYLAVYEGTDSTVGVFASGDGRHRIFSVNGKSDGSTGADMNTQVLVGQIPLLLHPAPRDVLVVGLGTGITLRGMAQHPTERIDCVEISPEVVRAEAFFRQANGHALESPKVSLHVADGRNLLLTTSERYDVIVSEPSNPWQAGNANLFTVEFYRLAAARLREGGVFSQWIGLYDITTENLKTACNTFRQVFPEVMVFRVDSDLILVGGHRELRFDYMRMWQRMTDPVVRRTLSDIGVAAPGDLLARHYLFSELDLARFCAGSALNTDDRPVLEFSARYTLGQKMLGEFLQQNIAALDQAFSSVEVPLANLGQNRKMVASVLRELGTSYARAGKPDQADFFRRQAGWVGPL